MLRAIQTAFLYCVWSGNIRLDMPQKSTNANSFHQAFMQRYLWYPVKQMPTLHKYMYIHPPPPLSEKGQSRSWRIYSMFIFKFWLWNFDCVSFHINETNNSWQQFQNVTVNNYMSRSWVRSRIKVKQLTQYPTDVLPFRFTSIRPAILEIWSIECLILKKHIGI